MCKVNHEQLVGWLDSHKITVSDISFYCKVSLLRASEWVNPYSSIEFPDMAIIILWNHFELGKDLELPDIIN